jgi:hypothetical protein
MSWITLVILAALGGAGLLKRARRISAATITRPVLGILDLDPERFGALASEDRAALGPQFSSVVESDGEPPKCDVLLVYCEIDRQGRIVGSSRSLRGIIAASGARIVVVATENEADSYVATARPTYHSAANMVMTLERKGDAFAAFLGKLFGLMFRGVSMPVAWVQLAPQIPGAEHTDGPELIFAAEVGQLYFKA